MAENRYELNKQLAISFHPELDGDNRLHQYFTGMYASQALLGELFKQWYRVTNTHHLYKIKAPTTFVGQTLQTIDIEENFGVRLVGIERPKTERNLIGLKQTQYSVIDKITGDLRVEEGDLFILFGKMEVLHRLAEI